MTMRQILIIALFFLSNCSTTKRITPGLCDEFFKSAKVQVIEGTAHCRSIVMANGVVIRTEENDPGLLQHIAVIQCPDSYKTYGDIGTNGVIVIDTKQAFDFTIASQVDFEKSSSYSDKEKIYFLDGFLITNDSLKISKNAIKRIEVLKPENFGRTTNRDSTVLINIWTLTKKELRKALKSCRRSYE